MKKFLHMQLQVWSQNVKDNSEDIAKKTFEQLQQHAKRIEETKTSLQKYTVKERKENVSDVHNLLALGEEVAETNSKHVKKNKKIAVISDSESEIEDWEEVKGNLIY